jgi:hypothetical protein
MSGAIHPFPQYAFMAWCSVETWGQLHSFRVSAELQFQYCPWFIYSIQTNFGHFMHKLIYVKIE